MPHNVIRSLHGLLQWPFLKTSLFRGAVTTCSRFWSKDFEEAYSIHKIRGIFCDKSSASRFLFHSEQDFDYPVSWLARSCSNFSYGTNRKQSFGQTVYFLCIWLYLKWFAPENCIWVYWANMFITWFERETWEKEFDPKGHVCLDNPAENVMACRDFV